MKRKILKPFLALTLMITMVFSMSFTALAIQKTDTANVTISGLDTNYDSKVMAYKVIEVMYDYDKNQPKNPTYKWNESIAHWVKYNFKDYIDNDGYVTEKFVQLENDGSEVKTFVDQLAKHILLDDGANINSVDGGKQSQKVDSVTYELGMGAYLFIVTDGMNIYSPGFAKVYPQYQDNSWKLSGDTIKVNFKRSEPSIIKTANKETVAIGDTVKYTLTVNIPQYPNNTNVKKLVISDQLSTGLTLDKSTVHMTTKNDQNEDVNLDRYFDETTVDGKTFAYQVKDDNSYDEIKNYQTLTVTYDAIVKSNAYEPNTLKNTATLTYNTEPYAKESKNHDINDDAQVYTYGIQITKTAQANDSVAGTQFELYKGKDTNDTLTFIRDSSGYYYLASGNDSSSTLTVDDNGQILIKGLDVGTYTLKEIKAPAGYTVPQATTKIVLTDDEEIDGKLDNGTLVEGSNVKENSGKIDDANKNQFNFSIINNKNDFNLPQTGGMGTMMFTIAGIVLMGGAVVLMLIVSKKRND